MIICRLLLCFMVMFVGGSVVSASSVARYVSAIGPRKVVFDMNGVLTRRNSKQALETFLSWQNLSYDLFSSAKVAVDAATHSACPLCGFSQCRAPKTYIAAPHVRQLVERGEITYEQMREMLESVLPHIAQDSRVPEHALRGYITFITSPGLWVEHTELIPEGGALARYYLDQDPHGVYLFSNMPSELFGHLERKFPDPLSRIPKNNRLISSEIGYRKPEDDAFKTLVAQTGEEACLVDDQSINVTRAGLFGLGGVEFPIAEEEE